MSTALYCMGNIISQIQPNPLVQNATGRIGEEKLYATVHEHNFFKFKCKIIHSIIFGK